MKIDVTTLQELEISGDYTVIACRWMNVYFDPEFVEDLRKEILRKIPLVKIGIDDLTKADVLAINFLNDLCEYQLNKKLIIKKENV